MFIMKSKYTQTEGRKGIEIEIDIRFYLTFFFYF